MRSRLFVIKNLILLKKVMKKGLPNTHYSFRKTEKRLCGRGESVERRGRQ